MFGLGLKLGLTRFAKFISKNIFCNSTSVFSNDDNIISANSTSKTIEAWFDYINDEFEKLYEIYT